MTRGHLDTLRGYALLMANNIMGEMMLSYQTV